MLLVDPLSHRRGEHRSSVKAVCGWAVDMMRTDL